MKFDFLEELRWRGMLHDLMPGLDELLKREVVTGYIGFDPTADSLHIGNLAQIMLLLHFQKAGHKPIALIGGATGMIGDPSGKKEERKLLSIEQINHNQECIKKQLEKFLDFSCENSAQLVNNYIWYEKMNPLFFFRDVGKYLTVNYLLNKGFIKDRMAAGQELSFTEFNYILMQAYDFLYLYENMGCKLQMGGSDQWGNITAGAELIRKRIRGDAFGLTIPLITKADGSKFGKTEKGNVWLDPKKTSPYRFYQFWLNVSDEDAITFIKIFTLLDQQTINMLVEEHKSAPHLRSLQKTLAKNITIRVHSDKDYEAALESSEILFGKGTKDSLLKLTEDDLLSIFEGVPQTELEHSKIEEGIPLIDFLVDYSSIFPSKGEAKKMIAGGGVSINKEKMDNVSRTIDTSLLIKDKFILVQKGKKNYYLIVVKK